MKKLTALFLALMLLICSVSALAEPATFMNGLHWGMTPEEADAACGSEPYTAQPFNDNVQTRVYNHRKVSRYEAEEALVFLDDRLVCGMYGQFSDNGDQTKEYLNAALVSLYGESTTLPSDAFVRFLSALGELLEEVPETIDSWQVNEETNLWMFIINDYIYLMYTPADLSMVGLYDTTGL